MRALLAAETPCVTIVGKTSDYQVKTVMSVSLEENLQMIGDTVRLLRSAGRQVIYDAEHFFDTFRTNREYALRTLLAAQEAGASVLVLCDTNGGSHAGARRGGGDGGAEGDRRARGHPHAQRRRRRRRQRAGGRPRRRGSRAGHDQRRRRAVREHGPHHAHPQPAAEVSARLPAGRHAPAPDGGQPVRLRDGEHEPLARPALRRQQRVRAQGRDARARGAEGRQHVRARVARVGRQHAQDPHQRAVRREQHRRQGRQAVRHRGRQGRAAPRARARAGPGKRRLSVRGGRGELRAAAPPGGRPVQAVRRPGALPRDRAADGAGPADLRGDGEGPRQRPPRAPRRRGRRPGQRARRRPAPRPAPPPPRDQRRAPDRLQGPRHQLQRRDRRPRARRDRVPPRRRPTARARSSARSA